MANYNNLFQFVQQGFRVTLGATTSLVETLQDDQKRQTKMTQLSTQLNQQVQEWAEKGEVTEQEARRVMDNFWSQSVNQQSNPTSTSVDISNPATSNSNSPSEIQDLTDQIINLRKELENLRQQQSNN